MDDTLVKETAFQRASRVIDEAMARTGAPMADQVHLAIALQEPGGDGWRFEIAGIRLRHRTLRAVMMAIHGVQPAGEAAFDARLRHLLDQGITREPWTDATKRRTYGLPDILEIALCLQLQRSYAPPATAARFVKDNRRLLDRLWADATLGGKGKLYVEIDAFAAIGGQGRDRSRGAKGHDVGTIRLDSFADQRAATVPPSVLAIDIADLRRRVIVELERIAEQAAGD